MATRPTPLLQVEDLHVEFRTHSGTVRAVRGASFSVDTGQTLAIVGESGCGKSATVQSILGLPPGHITSGSARLHGVDIIHRDTIHGEQIRGAKIGMIFQDAATALNPTMKVGSQIAETLQVHRGFGRQQAFERAVELLDMMRIPNAAARARQFPFELSGGMLQRALIAIAIACEPAVLIADEPTTALDTTIQAQILDLLSDLQRDAGMAIVLITHDLGIVARMAQMVAVMYAGQVVEQATVEDVFYRCAHPYTLGLRAAMPQTDPARLRHPQPIEGSPPNLINPPQGCAFAARCPSALPDCRRNYPPATFFSERHYAHCWVHHDSTAPPLAGLYYGATPT